MASKIQGNPLDESNTNKSVSSVPSTSTATSSDLPCTATTSKPSDSPNTLLLNSTEETSDIEPPIKRAKPENDETKKILSQVQGNLTESTNGGPMFKISNNCTIHINITK